MRYLFFTIILLAQTLQAQNPCQPVFCRAEDIYFDALTDQNHCQMDKRVSCQLTNYGYEMDRLIAHGNSNSYIKQRLKNKKGELVDNFELKGLLDTAELDYNDHCSDHVSRKEFKLCQATVQYAVTVYNKASDLFRSLELPYYSSIVTNQEVVSLYQISESHHKRSDFFKSLQLDMKIGEDLGLWKLLEIIKEASRNERAKYYICNDSPGKMKTLIADQKLLFLSGEIKRDPTLIKKAIDNLSKIQNVGRVFQRTCENPEVVDSILQETIQLKNIWENHNLIQTSNHLK